MAVLAVQLDFNGDALGEFYIVNLLTSIPALNRDRSSVVVFTSLDHAPAPVGSIKATRHAVLHTYALAGAPPLCRLEEDPRWVLVSPDLRQRLTNGRFTGFRFIDTELSTHE